MHLLVASSSFSRNKYDTSQWKNGQLFLGLSNRGLGLGLWCLTPLSIIFQLYRGGQFYWWRKSPTWLTLSHNVVLSKPRLSGIRTHNVRLVVISTYCIGSCKPSYHTMTTTMTTTYWLFLLCLHITVISILI